MAGNSQRKGAMRKDGTKKGMTVGSGGQRRKALKGKQEELAKTLQEKLEVFNRALLEPLIEF